MQTPGNAWKRPHDSGYAPSAPMAAHALSRQGEGGRRPGGGEHSPCATASRPRARFRRLLGTIFGGCVRFERGEQLL